MPTTQEIQSWLAANPTASDATIAAAMNQYGVSPAQMAAATGIAPEVVQSRYEAAIAPAPAPAPLSTVTAPATTTAPVADVAKPATSAPLSTVAAAAPVTPKATAEEIKNYFAGASGALPTMSQIQSDMAKYNVTEADIKAATGKTLEELNPTLSYYTGKQYEGNQVVNLARQLASATDTGALKGGVFGEKGASIGFNFDQAQKVLGDNPNVVGQVLLDAAAQLIDKGITDLSQLKTKDIMGEGVVNPELDANGKPTGRYIVSYGGDEYTAPKTRVATDAEVAQLVPYQYSTDEGQTGTAYRPIQTVVNKGIYDSSGKLVTDTGELLIGDTYTGPGGTQYYLTFDESGKPAFRTAGIQTGDSGLVAPLLFAANFIPGAQPFVAAANAALALKSKNPLAAAASLVGVPGVGDFVPTEITSALQTANQINNAVDAAKRGDLLALVNAGVNVTGTGGGTLGDTGLTVGDALKSANFAKAVASGNQDQFLRALSSVIGSQKTATAGGITNRTYDDTIVSAGAKAFVDAKNVGASDADAYAAADAVMIDLESSRPDGATIKKDLGEFAGIDEAIQKNAMDDLVRADKLDLIKNTPNFNDAFSQARALLGPNQTFEWNGKQYSTATFAENPALSGNVVPGATSTTAGGGRGSYAGFDAAAAAESAGTSNKPAAETKDIKETGFWSNLANSISNQMNLSSKAANDYLKNNPNSPITKSVSEAYEAAGELIKNAGGGTALMLDNKPVADALVKGGSDLINLGQSLGTGPQDTKNWNDTLSLIDKADGLKEKLAVLAGRVMDGTSGLGRQTAIELKQELPALFLGGGSFKAAVLAAGVIDAGDTGGSTALDEYQKSIKAGKSHQEALSDARTAGIAAGATELAVDLTLGKLAEFAVGKLGSVGAKAAGRVAGETVTEGIQEGAAAGAVDIASGRAVDVNNVLTNIVAGAAVGHSTSLSTAGIGAAQDIGKANEIKSAINNINTSILDAAKSGDAGAISSTISNSVKAALDSGVDTSSVVAAAAVSALTSGVDVDNAINSAVHSAINKDGSNAAEIADSIFSAVKSVGADINVTSDLMTNSLINSGVSPSTAVKIVSDAKTNSKSIAKTPLTEVKDTDVFTTAADTTKTTVTPQDVSVLETKINTAFQDAVKAGQTSDAALQAAINKVSSDLGTTSSDILSKLGTTQTQLQTQFSGQLSGLDAKLSSAIDNAIKAGQTGDAALQTAINKVASDLGTSSSNILSQLGKTQTQLQTQFSSQLSGLDAKLSTAIDNAIKAGQTGDAALQTAINKVSTDLGTTKTDLLSQLGKTQTQLQTQFSGQLSGVESKLNTAIQNAIKAGQTGDAALQTAINKVSSDLGTTKSDLLNQIGKTQQQLQTQFSGQLSGVESKLSTAINDAIKAGQTGDADLQTAIDKVSKSLGTTKTDLLSQIGKTEAQLKSDMASQINAVTVKIGGVETKLSDVNNSLTQKINEAIQSGQNSDAAINSAIESVAKDLSVTKSELLNSLNTTNADLKTQIQTQAAQTESKIQTEINKVIQTTTDSKIATDVAIKNVADELGITKEQLLDKLQTTEEKLTSTVDEQIKGVQEQIKQAQLQSKKDLYLALSARDIPTMIGGASYDTQFAPPTFLKSTVTGGAIDPLAAVKRAQMEMERDSMMQQIDPRLLGLLQQRMTPEQQPGQQFNNDIGALAQMLSGSQAANENPYYSYGSEDSIDSILGGRAANYAEGGYVEPLKATGGAMALPLLAKSGGALGHYGGREDFKHGKHVAGEGDGQSDDIPAWLADGEFVFPADVVSALGNGSTKAGTDKLYEMMHSIRDRARSKGPKDLPPPALKSPLDYLKSHKRSK